MLYMLSVKTRFEQSQLKNIFQGGPPVPPSCCGVFHTPSEGGANAVCSPRRYSL